MTIDELIATIAKKGGPPDERDVEQFEAEIGATLPSDYRSFLLRCNGGHLGGRVRSASVAIHHVGGMRAETHFSLRWHRECYQDPDDVRIPLDLLWIMDDPGGNAICLGIRGAHRGTIYFWDHELEDAGNLNALANSFTEFVAGLA